MGQKKFTRRTFLMGGAAAAAAGLANKRIQPFYGPNRVMANSKLNIGGIGAGGKGHTDINGCKSENLVAFADVDWNNVRQIFEENPNVPRYKDFRVMLDKHPEIDAVTVTTPDHNHAIIASTAMVMGKHVYVQKPLTYCVGEARYLTELARKTGVVTQMGNQGHSWNGTREMCEIIWSGDIGQVHTVHLWTNRPVWPQGIDRPTERMDVPEHLDWDLWLGPAPKRPYHRKYAPFNWRGWWDFGCGALGDMACHIADPANWAMRLSEVGPTSVELVSEEGSNRETFPNKSVVRYEFPARGDMVPVTIYWHDGGNMPPRPEGVPEADLLGEGDNGTLFIGTKGVATCDTYGDNARLLPDALMQDYTRPDRTIPRIEPDDKWKSPYVEWIDAIKNGTKPGSNFDYSGPLTEWVVMGNLALRFPGQKLEWDAKNIRVTNVKKANKHVMREYRKGWELPAIPT